MGKEKNVINNFLQHDPEKLELLEVYFETEGATASSIVGKLLVRRSPDGFSYRKWYPYLEFWHMDTGESELTHYTEWDWEGNWISVEDSRDYDLDELIDFSNHSWTKEEQEEIQRWYMRAKYRQL